MPDFNYIPVLMYMWGFSLMVCITMIWYIGKQYKDLMRLANIRQVSERISKRHKNVLERLAKDD